MARPYAGAAVTHLILGILSVAAGITWICLLHFFFNIKLDGDEIPAWIPVILSAKIICGFWFCVTGAVGCCIKSRGCTEGVFVALNVLNVIIWAPVLILVMAVLAWALVFGTAVFAGLVGDNLDKVEDQIKKTLWLWTFPAIGLLVGVVEFILSIVSYSIVCCCRPASADEGYEYQYEMK